MPILAHLGALLVVTSFAAQEPPLPPLPTSVSSSAGDLKVEVLTTLEKPWGLGLLPDGRVLVTEKRGQLRIWAEGKLSEPVTGVPAVVYRDTDKEQGGLLDVKADPSFSTNQLVYVSYVEAADPQPADATDPGEPRFGAEGIDKADTIVRGGAVARGRLAGNALTDVQVIWRQVPKEVGRGHFGHKLAFSPDGKLFITSGERMRFDPAQDLSSNLGKVVRINPDGTAPSDNPFVGQSGKRDDIWSYGHRNMLSIAFDPSGQPWVVEMGPLGGDELNRVEKGKNYGWPLVSNGDNYDSSEIPDHPSNKEFEAPIRTWTPVIAPAGAIFYSGTMLPGWNGSMLVGGLVSEALVRLVIDADKVSTEERIDMKRRIRDVIQMPDGSLLLLVDGKAGELLRVSKAQ